MCSCTGASPEVTALGKLQGGQQGRSLLWPWAEGSAHRPLHSDCASGASFPWPARAQVIKFDACVGGLACFGEGHPTRKKPL